jgi:hypothetical protein
MTFRKASEPFTEAEMTLFQKGEIELRATEKGGYLATLRDRNDIVGRGKTPGRALDHLQTQASV